MRKLFAALMVIAAVLFAVTGFRRAPLAADFDIDCTHYNYCTFTNSSGSVGSWAFSDWAAWGEAAIGSAVSFERPMSTHDPATLETPYTTTVVHTVGSDSETKFVRCTDRWGWRAMCREANKP